MFDKEKYNKEYYQKNKNHIKKKQEKWREKNPEYIEKWREKNKKHIMEYCQKSREYRKEYKKRWGKDNKEHLIEYNKKYYQDNKEKELIRKKKWRGINPGYHKEYGKRYYQKNYEKYKESGEKRYKDNPEYLKKWRESNSEKVKKYIRNYLKTEKGKASAQRGKFKRQAKERKTINTLTSQEWLDILEAYNYRCAYCDIEFDCENLPERDHVIPISKGGDNIKENVIPACRSCNAKKNNKILKIERS